MPQSLSRVLVHLIFRPSSAVADEGRNGKRLVS
jgi:hypothetical protein